MCEESDGTGVGVIAYFLGLWNGHLVWRVGVIVPDGGLVCKDRRGADVTLCFC